MVRSSDREKRVVLQYDARKGEYRIPRHRILSYGAVYAIKPEKPEDLLEYTENGTLLSVYRLSAKDENITVYNGSGSFRTIYNASILSDGRILSIDKGISSGKNEVETYTYDTSGSIAKKTYPDGRVDELQKSLTSTWSLKEQPKFENPGPKRITVLERNKKGLWTRITVEYMRDSEHNADPEKKEIIRYFDVEENVPESITQKEKKQEVPDIKEEETTTIVKEEVKEETAEEVVEEKAIPFALVEVKPKFQGGDANTFSKWVSQNLEYPAAAKANGLSGRVMVEFTVNTDGSVSDVKVLRGVDPELDAEAIRVIQSSPKWTPGEQRDSPVKVSYQFPVIFQTR